MKLKDLITTGPPQALNFPAGFNPHAADLWLAACTFASTTKDIRRAWMMALRFYGQTCRDAGLKPFERQADVDIEQAARVYLLKRRNHLVRFLNTTRMMEGVKPWSKKTTVNREGFGFVLKVRLGVEINDPNWNEKLYQFRPHPFGLLREGHAWSCKVDPALTLHVSTYSRNTPRAWSIDYTIECPLHIDPGVHDFEQFVLARLWKPITGRRSAYGDKLRRL